MHAASQGGSRRLPSPRWCTLQVSGKKALQDAGLGMGTEGFEKLDKTRCGVLIGTGMGGLKVFQDGVQVRSPSPA